MRRFSVALCLLTVSMLLRPGSPTAAAASEQGGAGYEACRVSTDAAVCIEVEQEDGQTRARVSLASSHGVSLAPLTLVWLRGTETIDPNFCAVGCGPSQEPWISDWYPAPTDGRYAARIRYSSERNGDVDRLRVSAGRSDRVHLASNCDESAAGQICVELDGRSVANRLVLTNTTTGTPADGEWINPHYLGLRSEAPQDGQSDGLLICLPGHCATQSEAFTLTTTTRIPAAPRWSWHSARVRYRWSATPEVRELEATYLVPQ